MVAKTNLSYGSQAKRIKNIGPQTRRIHIEQFLTGLGATKIQENNGGKKSMSTKTGMLFVSFSELTYDDNGHPRESKIFTSCLGTVASVTALREDGHWKIAIRRVRRRKERVFTCPMSDLEETAVSRLKNKKVFITQGTITIA